MPWFRDDGDRLLRRVVYTCAAVIVVSVMLGALLGCSMTFPMGGTLDDGEKVTGSATNFSGDPYGGTFELRTARGLTCSGVYRYTSSNSGTAPLVCNDGQAGSLDFTSNGFTGSGRGRIGSRAFALTF